MTRLTFYNLDHTCFFLFLFFFILFSPIFLISPIVLPMFITPFIKHFSYFFRIVFFPFFLIFKTFYSCFPIVSFSLSTSATLAVTVFAKDSVLAVMKLFKVFGFLAQ